MKYYVICKIWDLLKSQDLVQNTLLSVEDVADEILSMFLVK